jgi:putative tributyrin esterase
MRRAVWFQILVVLWLIALAPSARAADPVVKTVEFEAPSVGRTMKYNVALPDGYETSGRRYPVVYLLHGLTGNYTNWARMGAARAAAPYDLILVMPDGGYSWYVNWAETEGDRPNRWEDYLVKDLIGHVDAHFRTIARREGRAINGLSMGGYGSLMLGLRHPDRFIAVGSESGALAFARQVADRLKSGQALPARRNDPAADQPNPQIGIPGFSSQAERTPKGKMFTTAEQAESYDPFHLIASIPAEKLPHLYLDCGTEDRLISGSIEFAKVLMEKKIPFTYAQSPGEHNGAYWSREINHALAVQSVILRRSLAAGGSGVNKEIGR